MIRRGSRRGAFEFIKPSRDLPHSPITIECGDHRRMNSAFNLHPYAELLLRYSDIERLRIAEKVLSIHMRNVNAGT